MLRTWSSTNAWYFERTAAGVATSKSVECIVGAWARIFIPTITVQSATHASNKSTQRGNTTVCKALRDTLQQHVIDSGDDKSLEFFIHSNDEEIGRVLQDATAT